MQGSAPPEARESVGTFLFGNRGKSPAFFKGYSGCKYMVKSAEFCINGHKFIQPGNFGYQTAVAIYLKSVLVIIIQDRPADQLSRYWNICDKAC